MSPVTREVRNFAQITAGILSAGLGLHGFLLTSGLIDGGVTGVSMLLSAVIGWPLAVFIPLVNLPFIVVGYRHLGKAFAVRSSIAIGGLALTLAFVHFPVVTNDRVLDAVFGGFFLGAGIGLAVRGQAAGSVPVKSNRGLPVRSPTSTSARPAPSEPGSQVTTNASAALSAGFTYSGRPVIITATTGMPCSFSRRIVS